MTHKERYIPKLKGTFDHYPQLSLFPKDHVTKVIALGSIKLYTIYLNRNNKCMKNLQNFSAS